MKTLFPGYYRPTKRQFEELWKNAIFVPDTNVLLNLYRYSNTTRDRLLTIMRKYKGRIWLPHQVAKEFHANRLQVISEQVDAYAKIPGILDAHAKQIEGELGAYKRHPLIDTKQLISEVKSAIEKAKASMSEREKEHPNLLENDSVLDAITSLFTGCVGQPFDDVTLKNLYKSGEQRYACEIPPGFADAKNKRGDEKYGDLIVWQQILNEAKKDSKPAILITDDNKDDWWWRFAGKTLGPRPELVEEFQSVAKAGFYIYRIDQFMEYARSNLSEQISDTAIDEVRNLRRDDAVAKRFRSHLNIQERVLAERLRDLFRKKSMLMDALPILDERLDDIENIRESFDFRNKEIIESDNQDPAFRRSRHEFLAERSAIENERSAIHSELRSVTSEISQLNNKLRNLERHGKPAGLRMDPAEYWALQHDDSKGPFDATDDHVNRAIFEWAERNK